MNVIFRLRNCSVCRSHGTGVTFVHYSLTGLYPWRPFTDDVKFHYRGIHRPICIVFAYSRCQIWVSRNT